ncbi:hypothetical protein [Streptomyces sp. NPDC048659]|uniref:hypothetical protein n=1 Tax=Streptomyces sp. NPDC048659 TaxID=3155489 RepID=UPI0034177EB2
MTDQTADQLTARIYDSLVAFNGVACWDVLRLAQARQYLAEHLAQDPEVRDAARQAAGQPAAEHPMARALRLGAATIPDDIVAEICESTNSGVPLPWPEYTDRDAEVWHLTDETHDGDRVMLPSAGDMAPMLRRDVQRFFGPLTAAGQPAAAVCLSGPDRAPYWLELDPERAAALRDDLAPPTAVPAAVPVAPTNHDSETRAAALREAADFIEKLQAQMDEEIRAEYSELDRDTEVEGAATRRMATELRRLAAGAES